MNNMQCFNSSNPRNKGCNLVCNGYHECRSRILLAYCISSFDCFLESHEHTSPMLAQTQT
jgi:hypothetical protein